MQDFLASTFYGNTIQDWAIALLIAVSAFVLGKIVYWILGSVIRRLTSRTETQIDDFLLDTIDEPIVVVVTVLGLWVAIQTLVLPDWLVRFLTNAFQGATVIAVTWMAARLFDAFVQKIIRPLTQKSDTDLDDQLLPIVSRGGRISIWILGVIVALNNAGYDVAALIAGLGIGGLALAMAARDTVANVFGGVTIFTDRPFALRDRIQISGFDGTVEEIGIRSTRLRTLAGREVTIPNSKFADSPVENVTREPTRKVMVEIGLTYDTPPRGMRRALEILDEIAQEHQEAITDEYRTAFTAFAESSMNVLFLYYIRSGQDILDTNTSINFQILERFADAGLEMAFPTRTLHVAEDDRGDGSRSGALPGSGTGA